MGFLAHGVCFCGYDQVARVRAFVISLTPRDILRPTPRTIVALALIPNALMAIAAAFVHAARPVFNVDYFVLAALSTMIPSVGTVSVVLTLAFFVDAAFTFGPSFGFAPTEVVAAVGELRNFNGRTVTFAAAVIVGIIATAVLIGRLRGPQPERGTRARTALAALTSGAVLLLFDLVPRSGTLALASSSFFVAARSTADESLPPESGSRVQASADELRRAVTSSKSWTGPPKIVLVLVESMGLPKGATLEGLFATLLTPELQRRYVIRMGTVPYFGGTTSGEFRGLCGVRMNHFTVPPGRLDSCLPAQLKALGFRSTAYHGYNGDLFDRRHWYPRIGFDRMIFDANMRGPRGRPLPRCGVMFHGVCDSAVVSLLRRDLAREPERRELLYWLTLSTHFPLDPRIPDTGAPCDAVGAAGKRAGVCTLLNGIAPVLDGVARIAADSTLPPAWYVIAGDHTPRLLRPEDDLFVPNRVPFIELRPRPIESSRGTR